MLRFPSCCLEGWSSPLLCGNPSLLLSPIWERPAIYLLILMRRRRGNLGHRELAPSLTITGCPPEHNGLLLGPDVAFPLGVRAALHSPLEDTCDSGGRGPCDHPSSHLPQYGSELLKYVQCS